MGGGGEREWSTIGYEGEKREDVVFGKERERERENVEHKRLQVRGRRESTLFLVKRERVCEYSSTLAGFM